MRAAAVERWAWIMIFGGLLMLCLGLFVPAPDEGIGLGLKVGGGLIAVAGAGLIVARSRMPA